MTVEGPEKRRCSVPESVKVTVHGFGSEEQAREVGETVAAVIRELSEYLDLSGLDGITLASDYVQALAELDRGFTKTLTPAPSNGDVVGVAMTLSVLRGGMLKSHIVLNAEYIASITDADNPLSQHAVQIIAHECAHVEITHVFDRTFPETLLRPAYGNCQGWLRSGTMLACWDEYAACWLASPFGRAPTDDYETTLLGHMAKARDTANELIKAYRSHDDVSRVYADVGKVYSNLLKYAAYLLGELDGRGLAWSDRPMLVAALSDHWFKPYFLRLHEACRAIADNYGKWQDKALFEQIGGLIDDLMAEGGITALACPDGRLYFDIPFTPETTPN